MTDLKRVRYEVADAIASLTLARPSAANAFDLDATREFGAVIDAVAADPSVRVLVIKADGTRFCAGGDVRAMSAATRPECYVRELASTLDRALQRLGSLDKPVVAAVHGVVAGAGLALMLACDVVLSAQSTRFLAAYSSVGLTPDCGLTWLLPRAVGQQRALDLILSGRRLTATEAEAWGLINRVVADDSLEKATLGLAEQIRQLPPFALGESKRLIRQSWRRDRAQAGQDESITIARAVGTADAQQLIANFLGDTT